MTPKGRFAQLLILACSWVPTWGQSYQSSFSEVKFDRAKGPATIAGGVSVDAASGAASMEIPCGPGIGERGIKFRPTLSLRIAPQLAVSSYQDQVLMYTSVNGIQYWSTQTVDTLYQQGYGSSSFAPGTFDLPLYFNAEDMGNASYSLPGGVNGTVTGMAPAAMTKEKAEALITLFGLTGTTLASMPDMLDTPAQNLQPFIRVGSTGHLVLGLSSSCDVRDTLYSLNSAVEYRWPRRILVVGGDVAFEFAYVNHRYAPQVRPYIINSYRNVLFSAHFVLTRISNRFGESIRFVYDADGIGYTATWNSQGGSLGSVKVASVGTLPAPNMPALGHGPSGMGQLMQIKVTYQVPGANLSSYLLATGAVEAGMYLSPETEGQPGSASADTAPRGRRSSNSKNWGGTMTSLQPVKLTQEATGESLDFVYSTGPSVTWGTNVMAATVLHSVITPTRTISLGWNTYKYRTNYSPTSPGPLGPRRRPTWAYGVCQIADIDTTSDTYRVTTHDRVVPVSNWLTEPPQEGMDITDVWLDTKFYTAVTLPDGQTEVHRFVEPNGGNGEIPFLKHMEREVRTYAAGVDWSADLLNTSPSASTAYRWVVKDHFSSNGVGSPDVPYATRTREWDRESQVFSATESTDYDWTNFGWTRTYRTTAVTGSPSMACEVGAPGSHVPLDSTLGTEDVTIRTLDSKIDQWLFGRVSGEVTTRTVDNTGSSAVGAPPSLARVVDPVYNVLQSVTQGGMVTTTYNQKGATGYDAALIDKVKLTGAGLVHSESIQVGYGHDAYGFMNAITINPGTVPLGLAQTQDALGRPTSQKDFDDRYSTFTWDAASRLTSISPPGEVATTITYDDASHRKITVTRGSRVSEYVYNGFGDLVLERRQGPNGWSHKIFGYDGAGRKTGETIWLPTEGYGNENTWTAPNLLVTFTVTEVIPGTTTCKRWGPINPDTGLRDCKETVTTPPTTKTTTYQKMFSGTVISYDGRGRVIKVIDPNGTTTDTAYLGGAYGAVKLVTVGGTRTTTLGYDALGRLKTVKDALNQVTAYTYDASNRIRTATQGPNGEQVRTWTYNELGWLVGLVQPESGTTTYSGFTVTGKPTVTSYNGRVVTSSYDFMSRVTDIRTESERDPVTGNPILHQVFTYDVSGGGKLAKSQDGGTDLLYSYDPGTGRLAGLTTIVDNITFNQAFSYNTYGDRVGGHTSHRAWSMPAVPETGLPAGMTSEGSQVASCEYYPESWAPKKLTFGNGAASSFQYDVDQFRLMDIQHIASDNGLLEHWGYHYDGAGNLDKEKDLLADSTGNTGDTYQFDALNRLVGASIRSQTLGTVGQTFDYDTFGNRILGSTISSGTVPSTTFNSQFNANDPALLLHNRNPSLTSGGVATGAEYDAQGNLTKILDKTSPTGGLIRMTYDALGRVVAVDNDGQGLHEAYRYRADGLRTAIEVSQFGVYQKTRYMVYNDMRQLVSVYEKPAAGAVTWKRDILYLGTREVAEYDAVGMHVPHLDHLGTPRVVTGTTGLEESRQKLLPFGELLERSGAFKTAKGYTNHEQTDDSGLIYMQARFYLPQYGRFSSPDPARDQHFEFTQSWNIYSYVKNNPINSTDPTGMVTQTPEEDQGLAKNPNKVNGATVQGNVNLNEAKGNKIQAKSAEKVTRCTDGNTKGKTIDPKIADSMVKKSGKPSSAEPTQSKPSTQTGINGWGFFAGVQGEGGAVTPLAGGQANIGFGTFNNSAERLTGFVSHGGTNAASWSNKPSESAIAGANAGAGAGMFFTNASSGSEFQGVTPTTTYTIGFVAVSYGESSSGIWTLTIGIGKGIGLGVSSYDMTTYTGGD